MMANPHVNSTRSWLYVTRGSNLLYKAERTKTHNEQVKSAAPGARDAA